MVQTLEQQRVSNRGAVGDQVDRALQVQSQFHNGCFIKKWSFSWSFALC